MKRSDALELICSIFNKHAYQDYGMNLIDADEILTALEEKGMLPPVGRVTLTPDPLRPGYFKHSETKREWDDE